MRAVLCTSFDPDTPLTTGTAPDPVPLDDEVLIDVRAASVSFMDKLMTQGGYQLRPDLPYVPGTESAGIVRAVGADVTRFAPGDRVAGQVWYGGQGELMVAKHWRCAKIPDGVPFGVAATVLHNYLTAYCALIDRCALQKGETLFVTGATGGVGLAALEMGAMLGARVIAGVGDDAKADVARAAGADEVVNYRDGDLRSDLKELTGGNGVDVCFESIGGKIFDTMSRLIAWGGRISPIGFVSGEIPKLPMNLPLLKSYSVVGVFSGAWIDKFPDEAARASDQIMGWIAAGKLSPRIDRIMGFDQAEEALTLLAARKVKGRIVLEPKPGAASS